MKANKVLILKWLTNLFKYHDYPHSFKDQWISYTIWEGILSVSFDLRVDEHKLLLSMIPKQFLGCVQRGTLKIVNENNFYIQLDKFINLKYPEIIKSNLIKKTKVRGGSGGWHSTSDDFYTYDWEVFLDDGTSILYHNQIDKMDMVKNNYIYNARVQDKEFFNFLEKFK